MKEIYILGSIIDDVDHIIAAFSSRKEDIKYIEQNYPTYEYDAFFGEWFNTFATDPDDDYLYIKGVTFIK